MAGTTEEQKNGTAGATVGAGVIEQHQMDSSMHNDMGTHSMHQRRTQRKNNRRARRQAHDGCAQGLANNMHNARTALLRLPLRPEH